MMRSAKSFMMPFVFGRPVMLGGRHQFKRGLVSTFVFRGVQIRA